MSRLGPGGIALAIAPARAAALARASPSLFNFEGELEFRRPWSRDGGSNWRSAICEGLDAIRPLGHLLPDTAETRAVHRQVPEVPLSFPKGSLVP